MSENRRPIVVTLLALFVLGLALWNGLRLIQSLVFWSILKEYQASPGPLYTAISGGVWLLAGLSTTWGLWQGKVWAWFTALGGVLGYASWYWSDRLVFQTPHSNWPFALAFTVISIAFFSVLFHRGAIHFFFQKSPSSFLFSRCRHNNTRITSNKKNK
jgi:hypothetical protein